MELKSYQKRTLRDLEEYISVLNTSNNLRSAYAQYWMVKGVDVASGAINALRPYNNSLEGSPRVTLKVPTAGGKTFIACNAIGTIMEQLKTGEQNKVVVWFVPSDTILTQTLEKLQDANHPYRQRIDALFGHKVNVIDKKAALAAQGLSPAQLRENLTIFVLSAASFIENVKVKNNAESETSKPLAFRQNGNLLEFAGKTDSTKIEGVADTALIQVLASLRPVVIVDESHNFKADLRVEMLQNLSPRFILELTATPRDNSNVISFVDAMELKTENMVKLPVIVENRRSVGDVLLSSIRLRNSLEQHAKQLESAGGRYIRPIVLFQAQPKNADDSVTFDKIKEELISLGIPEEQIKIKTASKDELHGINLMSRDCEVRYIITVNALKEGWDCPFAYILASLANRTSPVDIEQILGRILRLPFTEKHSNELLNLSYVFTNSNDFQTTVTRIIESLMKCGFSKKDFREISEAPLQSVHTHLTTRDLFTQLPTPAKHVATATDNTPESGDDFAIPEEEHELIRQSINSENATSADDDTNRIQQEALRQGAEYATQIEESKEDAKNDPLAAIAPKEMYNTFNADYADVACSMNLPVFFTKIRNTPSFFDLGGKEEWVPLEKSMLTEGFNLVQQNARIDFNTVRPEGTTIDLAQNGKDDYVPVRKSGNVVLNELRKLFVDFSATKQKEELARRLGREIIKDHRLDGIHQTHIEKYVANAIVHYDGDQIVYLWDNIYQTRDVVVAKILDLLDATVKKCSTSGLHKEK